MLLVLVDIHPVTNTLIVILTTYTCKLLYVLISIYHSYRHSVHKLTRSQLSVTKIVTWNVKGMNNVIKRRKVLSLLKKDAAHIAFLQETHRSDNEHLKLRRDWVGQVFYRSLN